MPALRNNKVSPTSAVSEF